LSLIVEGTPDAIVIVDADVRVQRFNKALTDLLGCGSEIMGRYFSEFVCESDEAIVRKCVGECFLNGHSDNIEINMIGREGREVPVLANTTLLRDVRGNPEKILWVVTDVTVLREAERRLKEAMETKSAFTSMVSHELRTPLMVIKESINFLSEGFSGNATEEQIDFFEMCKRNIDRLSRLINNVLDFQKLASGVKSHEPCENDLNDTVREISRAMKTLAVKKQLDLLLELDPNLPRMDFDRDKIIQALTNLVGNAVNFTDNGTILIATALEENNVHVRVRDEGAGIAPENMPKLFQSFQRFGAGRLQKGGTGLGLAITKEIVECHHGSIWAESSPGRGTTFHFVLPIIHESRGVK